MFGALFSKHTSIAHTGASDVCSFSIHTSIAHTGASDVCSFSIHTSIAHTHSPVDRSLWSISTNAKPVARRVSLEQLCDSMQRCKWTGKNTTTLGRNLSSIGDRGIQKRGYIATGYLISSDTC